MKFICDDMLGRLARWLRILGYDTLYNSRFTDADIIAYAIAEERIIITKDAHLCQRYVVPRCVYVTSDYYLDQVAQVIRELSLQLESQKIMTRCLVCNTSLQSIAKNDIADHLPPRVAAYHDEFHRCSSCERIYWKGTHYDNTMAGLRTILNRND